jgi:hypothetical protein
VHIFRALKKIYFSRGSQNTRALPRSLALTLGHFKKGHFMTYQNIGVSGASETRAPELATYQTETLAECRGLANQASILSLLSHELTLSGFAGSTDIPELVVLSMLTRLFEDPVSLVVKGPSGAGKSFALQAALNFVPSEAYEMYSGMSEKALLYLKDLDLKHRMLVIGEAAGLADGQGRAFLRQLLSEGHVRYATVQSTDGGMVGEELDHLEGPTGLIMTTTAPGLHPEDESRMISVQIQESAEQIRAALFSQAKRSSGSRYEIDYCPWHALHEYCETIEGPVVVPYAEELAAVLPTSHFRVQRDFPKVLSLIKAHALMHSCTRELDAEGQLAATLDDYAVVHGLVADALAEGIEAGVPANVREVIEAVRTLSPTDVQATGYAYDTPSSVSQRNIAEHIERDQSVVSRHVRVAIDKGFLVDDNPGQGREAQIRLGGCELPQGYALPSPEELAEVIGS